MILPNDSDSHSEYVMAHMRISEFVQRYLANNGLVAINRGLAENLASLDHGVAASYMVYDASHDIYRPSPMAVDLFGLERVKVR